MVALLVLIGALNYCDRSAIASVLPMLKSDLMMSDLQQAGIGTFFLWAYGIASPFGGILADRESRSRVVVWSLVGASALTLVTGLVASTGQLLFVRVLLGFFAAAYLPAGMALIADYHGSSTRGTAIGLHTAGLSLGLVAGGAAAGYIGNHWGWRPGFFLLGGIGLAVAVFAQFYLRDAVPVAARARRPAAPPLLAGLASLACNRSYLIMILAGLIAAVGNNIFANWFPLYFSENYHMSLARAGVAGTLVINGAGVLGLVVGSMVSDRLARRMPERRLMIRIVTGLISMPFLFIFFSTQPELMMLHGCVFGYSFFHKVGDSNESPLVCDLLPPKLRSTAFGTQNSANCLAGGVGVALAGWLKSRAGLGAVFGGISGITLLATAVLAVGYVFFLKPDLARRAAAERAEAKSDDEFITLNPSQEANHVG